MKDVDQEVCSQELMLWYYLLVYAINYDLIDLPLDFELLKGV